MSALSFARYAIESVVRNRRRSLYAIVGVALALSLVTGSSIAVDSSAYGLLRAATRNVTVDFAGYDSSMKPSVNDSYLTPRVTALHSVADVQEVTPLAFAMGWSVRSAGGKEFVATKGGPPSLAFLPTDSGRFVEASRVGGALPSPGTVAIAKDMADDLGIAVGGGVDLSYLVDRGYYNQTSLIWVQNITYVNVSFSVSQIWTQERLGNEDDYYGVPGLDDDAVVLQAGYVTLFSPIVFNMADWNPLAEKGGRAGASMKPELTFLVWIDRGEVVRLDDVPGTVDSLEFIQRRLSVQGSAYNIEFGESGLASPLRGLGAQLDGVKLIFIALSLPVIALGTYLSIVGVELGLSSRRREVGILKSRGASNRQVFGSLLFEAMALGAGAGLIGLLLGVIVSRFLLGAASAFSADAASSPLWTDLQISLGTVMTGIGFGILLMAVSTYRTFKKVSKTDVAEALHHYSPSVVQLDYKPWMDLALLGISIWSIVSVVVGFDWVGKQDFSWMLAAALSLLILVGSLLMFVMPFFLSLSVVRLLTRSTKKLYTKFTLLVKPWTRELHYLVDKNITRNPKRASNLGVIISLSLAFALFISLTVDSSMAYEKDRIYYEIGGDAKVDTWSSLGQEANASATESLRQVPGVSHSVSYVHYSIWASTFPSESVMGVMAFNSTTYAEAVDPSGYYFVGSGSGKMAELARNGTMLLSERFSDDFGVLVGDSLTLRIEQFSNGSMSYYSFPMSVAGIVKGLPGLADSDAYMDLRSLAFLRAANVSMGWGSPGAILAFRPGADESAIVKGVTARLAALNLTGEVQLLSERLEELESEPAFRAFADFLYMEYALSIVTMTVGVGLIIFVAVMDREDELACIMARGSSGSQMRKVLMGESLSIMAMGLVVGVSVGVLTGYLFNELVSGGAYEVVERRLVPTLGTLLIVLVSIISLVAASALATSRAGKIKLVEVLRIRGG